MDKWWFPLLLIGLCSWQLPIDSSNQGVATAQGPAPSPEPTFAGRSLPSIRQQLGSEQPVVRRRAALDLMPFVLTRSDGFEEVLQDALSHADPAVAFWACEAVGDSGWANESVKNQLKKLAEDGDRPGTQLAACYADFVISQSDDRLNFLLDRIEQPLGGQTFQDTKYMATVMTAADYLARIGAQRLGDRTSEIVGRLKAVSQRVVQELEQKEVHGQAYHCQKACDRTALLLSNPGMESAASQLSIRPDVVPPPLSNTPQIRSEEQPDRMGEAWSGLKRPNILWISCEDISPNLGSYGDRYSSTPNLDQLAEQGVRYDNAFTHAGVCAVLRSGVITGRYPVSIGTQHMRSFRPTLEDSPCFPELLRQAGYFCTNRSKTDYQFQHRPTTWDREGNRHGDWRDRSEGQPFFSVINLTISHESQVRHGVNRHQQILEKLQPEQRHDPADAAQYLPPYFPNTPETRKDWAWYQDNISEMDRQAGEILQRLDDDGLTESTIVIFWSDHGQGLPRGKRWLYDSGTHVPLIVRFPDQFAAGTVRTDLVTLLDLAPTMLSVAKAPVPENMDGRILFGPERQAEPEALFFHRDRMDETYDLIRSVRDHDFRYVRNFQPQRIYHQYLEYLELMPTMQVWRELHHSNKLAAQSEKWFHTKPVEELYDVHADPSQLVNLAGDPEYAPTLNAMRNRLDQWQTDVVDWGMTPEVIMLDELWPNP